MSRLRRIADQDRIFFITANLANRVRPLAPSERDTLLKQLARQRQRDHFLLFGYVVMPDHVHILMAPNARGMVAAMHEFKRVTAERLVRQRKMPGPIWQPRFFDFVLRRVHDFWDKLAYIHQNPVEAGFVATPEQWKWSSAAAYAGRKASGLPESGRPELQVSPIDFADFSADRNALLWPAPWR